MIETLLSLAHDVLSLKPMGYNVVVFNLGDNKHVSLSLDKVPAGENVLNYMSYGDSIQQTDDKLNFNIWTKIKGQVVQSLTLGRVEGKEMVYVGVNTWDQFAIIARAGHAVASAM